MRMANSAAMLLPYDDLGAVRCGSNTTFSVAYTSLKYAQDARLHFKNIVDCTPTMRFSKETKRRSKLFNNYHKKPSESLDESLVNIAEALHLSPHTVTTYRARILAKMGFGSNAELTRYAIENGLV